MPTPVEFDLPEGLRRRVAEAVEHVLVAAAVLAMREGTPAQQQTATRLIFAAPSEVLTSFGMVSRGERHGRGRS